MVCNACSIVVLWCANPFHHLSMPINLAVYIAMSNLARLVSDEMRLGVARIPWVSSIKYVGVYIVGGKKLSFNIRLAKQSFFSACDCVYAKRRLLTKSFI
jgi:hypothetical protein